MYDSGLHDFERRPVCIHDNDKRIGKTETGTEGALALPASLRQNFRDVDELGEVLQTRRGFLGSRSNEVRREHEAVLPSASSLGEVWDS